MEGSCEGGNELLGLIKGGEFFDLVASQEDSAPLSSLSRDLLSFNRNAIHRFQ